MKVIFVLLVAMNLVSCYSIATSGAEVIYNRYSLQKSFKDRYIAFQINRALYFDTDDLNDTHIGFDVYQRKVLLTGQVPTARQRRQAERIVKNVPGVLRVYNHIEIAPPSSSLVRLSDSWITTKVKSKLFTSNDFDASQIKVITENGKVYLMGILEHQQAEEAIAIATDTDGVREVIPVFAYITITNA